MIDKDFFNLSSCQVALFFKSDYQLRALKVAGKIQEKLSPLFTVEPSTTSFPPNVPVPLEVPRVFLQGDPAGQIIVSTIRADIFFNMPENGNIESKLGQYVFDFAECLETDSFVRFGFIQNFKIIHKDALSIIKKNYICNDKLDKSQELNLGWLNIVDVQSSQVNRLINISINGFNPSAPYGMVTVDTNTRPNETLSLTPAKIKDYINECIKQSQDNINTYIECGK